MLGPYFFAAGFIVVLIYLVVMWSFCGTMKSENPELWIKLGEPSIFKSSPDSNIKVLKYLFSHDEKPLLAYLLKYLFILFIIIFAGFVFMFFYE